MIKYDVYLDDLREAPEGWLRCRYVFEVIKLIKAKQVRRLSLDHDLGPRQKTGYDLCVWMARHNKWSDEKPTIHSQNPVGAFAMKAVIDRYWRNDESYA